MERKENNEIGLALILIGWLLIIPSVLLKGWAAATLWRWFVVPFGILPIGSLHASGLLLLWSLLVAKSTDSLEGRDAYVKSIVFSITFPLFVVGVAFVVKSLM